jgi:hypothetical protein
VDVCVCVCMCVCVCPRLLVCWPGVSEYVLVRGGSMRYACARMRDVFQTGLWFYLCVCCVHVFVRDIGWVRRLAKGEKASVHGRVPLALWPE